MAGKFLNYDPKTNTYYWSDKLVEITDTSPQETAPSVLDRKDSGGSSFETGTPAPQRTGSIYGTSFGLSAFGTGLDVASAAANPVGAAVSGLSSLSDLTDKQKRAAAFEAAARPGATIADQLNASHYAATRTDIALGALDLGLAGWGVATAVNPGLGVIGLVSSAINTIADVFSRSDAEDALNTAAAMEQDPNAVGAAASYGFGYANTKANFQEQQAKNLEAARASQTPTTTAANTAQATIEQALSSATTSSLGTGGLSSAGAGFSSDSSLKGTAYDSGSFGTGDTSGYNTGSSGISEYGGSGGLSREKDTSGFSGTGGTGNDFSDVGGI